MTEAELLQAVRDLARLRGWYFFHPYDSRKSTPGWPDVFLLHPRTGQIVVAELKSARGVVTADQTAWLRAFATAGIPAYVWRPADLASGAIVRALSQPGRPVAAAAAR